MSEVVEEQQPEAAPVDNPQILESQQPAPAEPDLDALLEQFDQGTKQPEPEPGPIGSQTPNAAPDPQFQEGELDKLLRELNADTEKSQRLEGELNALKRAEAERLERAEFEDFANNLQKRLPEWIEPDRAMRELAVYAHDPAIRAAWETRGVSAAERRAAPQQLAQLEALYKQVQAGPDDGRK